MDQLPHAPSLVTGILLSWLWFANVVVDSSEPAALETMSSIPAGVAPPDTDPLYHLHPAETVEHVLQ